MISDVISYNIYIKIKCPASKTYLHVSFFSTKKINKRMYMHRLWEVYSITRHIFALTSICSPTDTIYLTQLYQRKVFSRYLILYFVCAIFRRYTLYISEFQSQSIISIFRHRDSNVEASTLLLLCDCIGIYWNLVMHSEKYWMCSLNNLYTFINTNNKWYTDKKYNVCNK